MAENKMLILQQLENSIKIVKWKVYEGAPISLGRVLFLYNLICDKNCDTKKLKATQAGTLHRIVAQEGDIVHSGGPLFEVTACSHPTVMKDMCAECGADLRKADGTIGASVPMIHSVPDLKVSEELAQKLGQADNERLLRDRKLVLLVDLDQTLIHTTNDNIPANIKDVYHFQLYGSKSPWYHTRFRPGTQHFLEKMAELFELHICTFGARNYAHMIAMFLDPDGKYFSTRILSRDECFDPTSKTANLKALFPCGDNMVCIIDDREDVWSYASNLIHVKPYHFFQHTGDINAPPGLDKHEGDEKESGIDLITTATREEKTEADSIIKPKEEEKPDESVKSQEKAEVTPSKEEDVNKKEECDKEEDSNKDCAKLDKEVLEKPSEKEQSIEKPSEKAQSIEKPVNEDTAENKKTLQNGNSSEKSEIVIKDPDNYLDSLEKILTKIHVAFYEMYDKMKSGSVPDLKSVIPIVRSKVLVNTRLVFSGIVPTHIQLQDSKAYLVAKSLGAEVTQDLQSNSTHLVAVRSGTAKVNAARRKKGLYIVTPEWLWTCAECWEKVDEKLFPLSNKPSKNRHPPPHCSSPEHVPSYDATPKPGIRKRTPSGRFMDTINPLMSFSSDDIADMDREVEDILESDSDGEHEPEKVIEPEETTTDKLLKDLEKAADPDKESTTSDESLSEEQPKGWRPKKRKLSENAEDESTADEDPLSVKFRRGEELPSDVEIGQDSNSEGSDDGDWNMMGAALEREFLANN